MTNVHEPKNGKYFVAMVAGGPENLYRQIKEQGEKRWSINFAYHLDESKPSQFTRAIPGDVDFVLVLTDFIGHSPEGNVVAQCHLQGVQVVRSSRKRSRMHHRLSQWGYTRFTGLDIAAIISDETKAARLRDAKEEIQGDDMEELHRTVDARRESLVGPSVQVPAPQEMTDTRKSGYIKRKETIAKRGLVWFPGKGLISKEEAESLRNKNINAISPLAEKKKNNKGGGKKMGSSNGKGKNVSWKEDDDNDKPIPYTPTARSTPLAEALAAVRRYLVHDGFYGLTVTGHSFTVLESADEPLRANDAPSPVVPAPPPLPEPKKRIRDFKLRYNVMEKMRMYGKVTTQQMALMFPDRELNVVSNCMARLAQHNKIVRVSEGTYAINEENK